MTAVFKLMLMWGALIAHACLLSSGMIAKYGNMAKEIGHDQHDTGRSVA